MGALSAAAARCASTIPWRPRLPWLQLSGTVKPMMVLLTPWWPKAVSLLLGSVMFAATSGVHHLVTGSARQKLAAHSVQKPMQKNCRTKQPTFAECKDPEVRALLAQWDHPRNAQRGHFPEKVRLQSHKQIFWLCNNCPAGQKHSWCAPASKRAGRYKIGCPFCVGRAACKCNSLQALYPGIAVDWDHAKNEDQPSDYTASSNRMAWWFSPERGSWQQRVRFRTDLRLKRNQQEHS